LGEQVVVRDREGELQPVPDERPHARRACMPGPAHASAPCVGTVALALSIAVPWLVLAFLVFLIFFERGLPYRVTSERPPPLESEEFERVLAALADAQLHRGVAVDLLADGAAFYEAQLDAIRAARHSVHLEQYIFRA